jgi:hypothetical protein
LLATGLPGYLATEEGLAVYWEERAGLLQSQLLYKYAARVIAAHLALTSPFFEVFSQLVPFIGEELAFKTTLRAKRGFIDTSQPGAHIKDSIYLRGYLQVKAHLNQHPDDHAVLFVGKVGLKHIPLLRSLIDAGRCVMPNLLPQNILDLLHN